MAKTTKTKTRAKPNNTNKKSRAKNSAAKSRSSARAKQVETDGAYFLKLVLYIIIGSQWLWVIGPGNSYAVPLPIGLVIGLFFASHDKFQIDRKIEYALLLIAMLIGFWAGIGITLHA